MNIFNPEIRIETTSQCNSKCVICAHSSMTRKKTTMQFAHFLDIINQAQQLGYKTASIFGFGEPLQDRALAQKVYTAGTLAKMETFVTTNASLLDIDRASELLDAGLSHIRFSVHGTYDNYERVHQGLKWPETWRNIANFLQMNKSKYNSACKTSVTVIPMHGESVNEIRRFWGKRVDFIEIWKPHNWGGKKSYRELRQGKKTCGRPFSGPLQIQADGNVIPCCFLTDGEIILGNAFDTQLEDILKGDKYNELRARHKDGDLKGLPCAACDQLNEGDSPLLYSNRDPSMEIGVTSSTKFKLMET